MLLVTGIFILGLLVVVAIVIGIVVTVTSAKKNLGPATSSEFRTCGAANFRGTSDDDWVQRQQSNNMAASNPGGSDTTTYHQNDHGDTSVYQAESAHHMGESIGADLGSTAMDFSSSDSGSSFDSGSSSSDSGGSSSSSD